MVRVRIAPSPTGSPHVGTAYIGLFNYCFAKSHGGTFVLRIEDTDQSRSKREHEDTILEALRWVGLTWDEGPDVGGPHGPYRQSERTEIYRKYVQMLVDKGAAYPCFCTPERLDALRKEQMASGAQLGYDGHCLTLTKEEVAAKMAAGEPYTIRLKVPESGACVVKDRLRGEITFDYSVIDHQVLLKSDGYPTYHLANVVDDHLMGITHVIRGEEWLPSLPKHILLYEAFGWEPPEVIHMPLLRNPDGTKLSKRKNPTSILYYEDDGILPEALLNFLGMMAYSLPDGKEQFSLEEMVSGFDINRVHLGGPIFDRDKLKWLNGQYIGSLSPEDVVNRLEAWRLNKDFMLRLAPLMLPRMKKLGDFMTFCDSMFYSDLSYDPDTLLPKGKEKEDTRDYLMKFMWELETLSPFDRTGVEQTFKKTSELHGWKIREATHAVYVAVLGKKVAPPLYDAMEILGSDVCRNRILEAVGHLGELGKKKLSKLQKAWKQQSDNYQPQTADTGA